MASEAAPPGTATDGRDGTFGSPVPAAVFVLGLPGAVTAAAVPPAVLLVVPVPGLTVRVLVLVPGPVAGPGSRPGPGPASIHFPIIPALIAILGFL